MSHEDKNIFPLERAWHRTMFNMDTTTKSTHQRNLGRDRNQERVNAFRLESVEIAFTYCVSVIGESIPLIYR